MVIPSRIVLAVGGCGYLLGRTKKLKFALSIGSAVTGRALPSSATDLARMGARLAMASPELSRLRGAVRGPLLVAGRDAAIAVAVVQLEALTAQLSARIDALTDSSVAVTNGTSPAGSAAQLTSTVGPAPSIVPGDQDLVVESIDGIDSDRLAGSGSAAGNGARQGAHS